MMAIFKGPQSFPLTEINDSKQCFNGKANCVWHLVSFYYPNGKTFFSLRSRPKVPPRKVPSGITPLEVR